MKKETLKKRKETLKKRIHSKKMRKVTLNKKKERKH